MFEGGYLFWQLMMWISSRNLWQIVTDDDGPTEITQRLRHSPSRTNASVSSFLFFAFSGRILAAAHLLVQLICPAISLASIQAKIRAKAAKAVEKDLPLPLFYDYEYLSSGKGH